LAILNSSGSICPLTSASPRPRAALITISSAPVIGLTVKATPDVTAGTITWTNGTSTNGRLFVGNGGTLINMLPGRCTIEADIRLPWGVLSHQMIDRVEGIVARHPPARMRVMSSQEPAWSDPDHPMVRLICRNARDLSGLDVRPIPSLAGTDARLWRQRGVPAFTYGTTASNVAMPDEHTDVEEWMGVVKTQALSSLDYLMGDGTT
jgi:succinyl-diaminopimelate desuccinylase